MSPHPHPPHPHHHNIITPPDEEAPPSWFVIQLTATASLGGLLFGYDMGAISGALPQLQSTLDLNNSQLEWVVSILFVGGGLGATMGGSLCDAFGRKVTIMGTDVIFILGATGLYFAHSYPHVLMGRLVVGMGVAISGIADVSYLHECAPLEWRGSIVSVNEACISLGFLLAYVAGFIYNDPQNEEWRLIFGWAGILAAIQFLGMIPLPESPAWLVERGRMEDARKAFQQINSGSSAMNDDNVVDNNNNNNEIIHPVLYVESIDESDVNTKKRIPNNKFPAESHVYGRPRRKGEMANANSGHASPLDDILPTQHHDPWSEADTTYQHHQVDIYDADSIQSLPFPNNDGKSCIQRIQSFFNNTSKGNNNIQSTISIISRYRRQVYIMLFLAVVQQFCGQTIVLNYAPMIFAEATRIDNSSSNSESENDESENRIQGGEYVEYDAPPDWSMVAIGLVKFAVTVVVIWRIEYVGRRTLMLTGTSLIVIGLVALIIAFGGSTNNDEKVDDDDTDNNNSEEETSYWNPLTELKTFQLALPGVLLVVTGYSMSFGPLTWLLTSELFPTQIRGRALGVSTIVTYGCAALVTKTFLSAQSVFGPSKVFGVYCIITMLGIIFVYFAIPDTGDKTVEQIEEALGGMYWWRFDSFALSQMDQDDNGCNNNNNNNSINAERHISNNIKIDLDSLPSLT